MSYAAALAGRFCSLERTSGTIAKGPTVQLGRLPPTRIRSCLDSITTFSNHYFNFCTQHAETNTMLIRAPSYIFNSKTRTIYSAAMELQQHQQEQARKTVADKWLKPHGPPVGATFGARVLKDDDDVFNHNAWWVHN